MAIMKKRAARKFQYPSSRVILPDNGTDVLVLSAHIEFQYPSSRVILPDRKSAKKLKRS